MTKNQVVLDFNRSIQRHLNCLSDENKNVRYKALSAIHEELSKFNFTPEDIESIFINSLLNFLLKAFLDKVEKNRELSVKIMEEYFNKLPHPEKSIEIIIPAFVNRLGQQEILEPSEEIRLQTLNFLHVIINTCAKHIAPFVGEIVKILQQTVVDAYPEVKKVSCLCASSLAKSCPEYFHNESELLIKPLLLSITHQHSKVRVQAISTIGTVIQYGNNKSVDDVVSHLAQRLFDNSVPVRLAVVNVIGNWLLNLPDRYSYQHKLLPLLLSGLTDDVTEVQSEADAMWNDVGEKYLLENEDQLKDKIDFDKPLEKKFPLQRPRTNLGCRELISSHFSKILPAISNDINDWIPETRVKAVKLLLELLVNVEVHVVQHLNVTLECLYKASTDPTVSGDIMKSAQVIGFFVDPSIWVKMIIDKVKTFQTSGSVLILANVIKGAANHNLSPYFPTILYTLDCSGFLHLSDESIHDALLRVIQEVLKYPNEFVIKPPLKEEKCDETNEKNPSLDSHVFNILFYIKALAKEDSFDAKATKYLEEMDSSMKKGGKAGWLEGCMHRVIKDDLVTTCHQWTSQSPQLRLFESMLAFKLSYIHPIFPLIITICQTNLHPDVHHELKHRFFTLLNNVVTALDQQKLKIKEETLKNIVVTLILPNLVWRVGRMAEVVRKTGISCLWSIMSKKFLSRSLLIDLVDTDEKDKGLCGAAEEVVKVFKEGLLGILTGLLSDDNKGTRLTTLHVLNLLFEGLGEVEDEKFPMGLNAERKIYNFYPELLKRLDDSCNEVRAAATKAFSSYLKFLAPIFDTSLYNSHLMEIFDGLLVHMDDSDPYIQKAVFSVLKKNSYMAPQQLLQMVEQVKFKHRSTKYCDSLTQHIFSLKLSH